MSKKTSGLLVYISILLFPVAALCDPSGIKDLHRADKAKGVQLQAILPPPPPLPPIPVPIPPGVPGVDPRVPVGTEPVPEPLSLLLLGTGLAGVIAGRKLRNR
jgi:hypothetical protein